jgi:hypothetical protein
VQLLLVINTGSFVPVTTPGQLRVSIVHISAISWIFQEPVVHLKSILNGAAGSAKAQQSILATLEEGG